MIKNKKEVLISIKKARGIIEKVIEMVEKDKYCIDIMQQILAIVGLLKSARKKLMENHLETCFKEGMISKNRRKQNKMIKEILKVAQLMNK